MIRELKTTELEEVSGGFFSWYVKSSTSVDPVNFKKRGINYRLGFRTLDIFNGVTGLSHDGLHAIHDSHHSA